MGSSGKRTKFQTRNLPQLVVVAKPGRLEPPVSNSSKAPATAAWCSDAEEGDSSSAAAATCSQDEVDGATIRTAHHPEDGILLEQISFENVDGQHNLHPIDQARDFNKYTHRDPAPPQREP